MAKKRFIAAFSPDASEVAAEVSLSSSAGSIRRRRSPDPPAAASLPRGPPSDPAADEVLPRGPAAAVGDVGHRDYRSRDPHPPVAR